MRESASEPASLCFWAPGPMVDYCDQEPCRRHQCEFHRHCAAGQHPQQECAATQRDQHAGERCDRLANTLSKPRPHGSRFSNAQDRQVDEHSQPSKCHQTAKDNFAVHAAEDIVRCLAPLLGAVSEGNLGHRVRHAVVQRLRLDTHYASATGRSVRQCFGGSLAFPSCRIRVGRPSTVDSSARPAVLRRAILEAKSIMPTNSSGS